MGTSVRKKILGGRLGVVQRQATPETYQAGDLGGWAA